MSICSGIGAPELSAPWIDWKYQSEIEAFPCAVLKERFPDAVNLGDMTKFEEWPDATVDVLCGGTPCQSFSVAGLRQGLADPRGNLMLTYLAIARRYRPRWVVWENVPGVYSALSHTAPDPCPPPPPLDMGCDGAEVDTEDEYDSEELHGFNSFLAGLSELGYGFAYRTFDAQYGQSFQRPAAVPQRRLRVFVVGYIGDWRRAAAVLFDGESLSGNPPPRREAGQIAPTIPSRSTGGGGLGTDFDLDGGLVRDPVLSHDPACTLTARDYKGPLPEADLSTVVAYGLFVSHSLRGEGFDASEDGTGRGTPLVPVAFAQNQRGEVRTSPVSLQLTTGGGKPGEGYPAVMTPWAVRRLTPTECERLQGFEDGFTSIPYRNKPADQCPDGPRYKALGNSWAINCGEYIFDRIKLVEAL